MLIELDVKFPQECFTHYDGEKDVWMTFLVETMKDFVTRYPNCNEVARLKTPITKDLADYCRRKRGIEQDRIDRLKTPYLFEPVIAVVLPDYSTKDRSELLVVDGNHRIVKLAEAGRKKIDTYIFSAPFWENFLLQEDIQAEMLKQRDVLNSPSNIIERKG